ncbi:MAG: hypothetical protein MUO77_12205 [Anaerolineales bacterium]|nr:hypothetical protein [Anaerolineales bacterium]
MEDILKVLVNSRQQGGSSNSSDNNQDPLGSLVGSLLGGSQSSQGTSGNLMGSLVGSLLGGGQQQTGGNQQPAGGLSGMMGLLETVMGGSGSSGVNDPIMGLLQPFIAPLAKKANISPEIATVVVSFVVHKLLAHHPTSGRDSTSFNFEDMFQQMGTGKIDQNMLQSSGMVKELAAKTGLDEATAAKSLELGFNLVGKNAASLMNKSASKSGALTKTVKNTASTSRKVVTKSTLKSGKTKR